MLDTNKFITQLISNGYSHLCVVPCSFVKSLINAAINLSDEIEYVPCASEAVACSVGAGLKMSGKNPIVIAQSSGLTNMGSCITSLLKPYEINLPIIVSWRTYKEGDSEIQHKHLAKNLPNLVEAYGYSPIVLDKDDLHLAVKQIQECEDTNQICLLEKETQLELGHPSTNGNCCLLNIPIKSPIARSFHTIFSKCVCARSRGPRFIGT